MFKRYAFFLHKKVEKTSHQHILVLKLGNIVTENNTIKLKYLSTIRS